MVHHTDGLPKPIYCISNGVVANDARCGWQIPPASGSDPRGTNFRVATTGASNFYQWYHDNPYYNIRSGIVLTLTSNGQGAFIFDSGSGFFPLALNGGFGRYQCLATASGSLNCTNGGRAFPASNKINQNEGADRQYSYTSELHTFFQLNGTENFTFSGVRLQIAAP